MHYSASFNDWALIMYTLLNHNFMLQTHTIDNGVEQSSWFQVGLESVLVCAKMDGTV